MAVIKPLETTTVADFNEFCEVFSIETDKVAGEDGADQELIEYILANELKFSEQEYLIQFVDDNADGKFHIHLMRDASSGEAVNWIAVSVSELTDVILIGLDDLSKVNSLEYVSKGEWENGGIRASQGTGKVIDEKFQLVYEAKNSK